MPWLLRIGDDDRADVLATLEIAGTRRDRARGLLGRAHIEGAILLDPCRSVHTFTMRFPLDVAWCDADGRVLRVKTVAPNRMTRPVGSARSVVEAEAGAFTRWGLVVGDRLDVRR